MRSFLESGYSLGDLPANGDAPAYLKSTVLDGATPVLPPQGTDMGALLLRVAIVAAVAYALLKMLNKR